MILEFTPRAVKEFNHLDKKIAFAFKEALTAFANGEKCDSKKLKGFSNRYRIRVRDYRAVFDVIIQDDKMIVIRIAHRKEVYKNIKL